MQLKYIITLNWLQGRRSRNGHGRSSFFFSISGCDRSRAYVWYRSIVAKIKSNIASQGHSKCTYDSSWSTEAQEAPGKKKVTGTIGSDSDIVSQ